MTGKGLDYTWCISSNDFLFWSDSLSSSKWAININPHLTYKSAFHSLEKWVHITASKRRCCVPTTSTVVVVVGVIVAWKSLDNLNLGQCNTKWTSKRNEQQPYIISSCPTAAIVVDIAVVVTPNKSDRQKPSHITPAFAINNQFQFCIGYPPHYRKRNR